MDDKDRQEVRQNKAIRGYILRSLAKGFNCSLLVRQISNSLVNDGLVVSPDISKHLDYLSDAEYIEFTGRKINSFNAYREDAVVKLTKRGVDLVEYTIEDPGVDV